MNDRPLPQTEDHDTCGHWMAAREGEVAIRECVDCGAVAHLPRSYCSECGGWNTAWEAVTPAGTLWSFTTTERRLRPGFDPPYTVVVVELDDAPGTRLTGFLPGRPALEIGMPMRARFERRNGDVTLVQWEPRATESS